ncbi:MAG: S8 family serine peptidase [Muribaculaceae bacterium]|nr:S8 family serine peptidase [Muribaculaceae bacterium]
MKRYILSLTFLFSIIAPIFSLRAEDREPLYIPRIVKIQRDAEIDSLENRGVEVWRRRGDILLCMFPNTTTRTTRSGDGYLSRPKPLTPTLDKAGRHYDALSIHTGAATGIPYTGKGVVVGICDIGIDPLHPTFLDADGKSRIKRVVQYVEQEGIRLQLDGDDDYRGWVTDNPDMYHATHVCGILAGGGAGTPYVGMAPDAEIVVTVSTLTEVGLLAGVEDIIDYAKESGKPAVINISVGSYIGPHDGSSLFSQYLDMCADDAVIVLSSGNEGSHKNSLVSEFTADRRTVTFRLGNKAWDQFSMYGVTDIWSATSSPLSVTLGVYDTDEKKVVDWFEPLLLTDGEPHTYSWSDMKDGPGQFPFEGELVVQGGVDTENGRHCTSLGYEFKSSERASDGAWARYVLAVEVSGEPGDEVEVYADGTYTRLVGHAGNPSPNTDLSISDLACGFDIISVGMYGNRDFVPRSHPEVFDDEETYEESTGYRAGGTVVHSSYGTLRDGRVTPTTVAPGATVMSAASRHYLELYPFHPHLRSFDTVWLDESGTSMSSPYVAGCIATWLEAVPALTSEEVKRIIGESNRIDIDDPYDPHNGNGYFDPVGGLRLALQAGGVEFVECPEAILSPYDHIEAYDVSGVRRYAGAASGLSGIAKGLYVVRTSYGVFKKIID